LAAYPAYVADAGRWLDGAGGRGSVAAAALRLANADGLARASAWSPGLAGAEPAPASFGAAGVARSAARAGGAAHAAAPSGAGPSASLQGPPGQPGSDEGRPTVLPRPASAAGARAAETDAGVPGLAGGERGGGDAPARPAAAEARFAAAPQLSASAEAQRPLGGPPSAWRDRQSAARSQEAAGADAAAHALGTNPGSSPAQAPLRPGAGSWAVAMGEDGLLVGAARPAPASDLARLLHVVLDGGHEPSEEDIVRLFAARGADFDAVCAAAGAPAAGPYPRTCGMLCKNASAFETLNLARQCSLLRWMLAVCGALALVV